MIITFSLISEQATKAHFEFGINTKGGAIYGLFLESALASAKSIWGGGTKEPNRDDLPSSVPFQTLCGRSGFATTQTSETFATSS